MSGTNKYLIGEDTEKKEKPSLSDVKDIKSHHYLERRVHKSNHTSGKVTVPISWIGKTVYVVLLEENEI